MPSPFPGMDPFIEMDEWQEFHVALMAQFQLQLAPRLRPKYVARIERRVYLEHVDDRQVVPDVQVIKVRESGGLATARKSKSSESQLAPRLYSIPVRVERREPYLVLKTSQGNEIVTVIELLSPSNKRKGSVGYLSYEEKREEVLQHNAHLVEIDLLRGGARPATCEPLQATTDYCCLVHRRSIRPQAEVYEWSLPRTLPAIPVPLSNGDSDVLLDLQQAFDTAYEAAGYDLTMDYQRKLSPPIRKQESAWLKEIIRSLTTRRKAK